MKQTKDILNQYRGNADLLSKEIRRLKLVVDRFSISRLVVFLLGILAIYLLFDFGIGMAISIGVATVVIFLLLVKIQFKKQEVLDFERVKLSLLENEISILNGGTNVYSNGHEFEDPNHPYAADLDIFGEKSLFSYINRSVTTKATIILATWLSKAANKTLILDRQTAVAELRNFQKDILDFRTRLFPLNKNQFSNLDSFISIKLSEILAFLNKKSVSLFVRVLPFLSSVVLIVAVLMGGVWWSVFGLVLLLSAGGYIVFKKRIDYAHETVGKTTAILFNYSSNLKWIENTNWQTTYLKQKVQEIKGDHPVHAQIKELAKIIQDLDYRLNPFIGAFLNLMFQWDLRCLIRLSKWQQKYNTQILKSFALMAEFEALISLAVLDYNHPDWVVPVIKDDFGFEAKELGHPLIPITKRINNNFKLKNQPTVDVITGSNMAGKSTFLRTVGINMVLAFAGAKVCAVKFETSVFNLLSYMRIKDSLTDDTSTFKAEINRLKMILDQTAIDKHAFVLIDEMLRGTNSKDKYLGSKVFIKKLISQGTPGFIATHDLQIAELEQEYPDNLRNYHFDIQVNGDEMYFDYLIKDGECKTFNASMLLKAIGLDVEKGS